MKTQSKALGMHSSTTGAKYYDKTAGIFKASAMHYIDKQKGIGSQMPSFSKSDNDLEEAVAHKRARIEKEDYEAKISKAKDILEKNTRARKVTLGRNCKLLPTDRSYIQQIFSIDGIFGDLRLYDSKFPG